MDSSTKAPAAAAEGKVASPAVTEGATPPPTDDGQRPQPSDGNGGGGGDGEGGGEAGEGVDAPAEAADNPFADFTEALASGEGMAGTVAEIPVKNAPADQRPVHPGHSFKLRVLPQEGLSGFMAAAGKALGDIRVHRVYFQRHRIVDEAAYRKVMQSWNMDASDRQLEMFATLVRHHWANGPAPGSDSPITPLLVADRLMRANIAWEFACHSQFAVSFNKPSVAAIATYTRRDDTTAPVRRVCAATVGVLACGARSAGLCGEAGVLHTFKELLAKLGPASLGAPVDSVELAGCDLLAGVSMAELCAVVVGGMASRRTGVDAVVSHAVRVVKCVVKCVVECVCVCVCP